ncbi:MAG TPA: class I SAM-dependent methyltransferase [Nitrospiria bacterium]|nr:class I SAM-dependent methyltransferase [Nitrospiria bacterium]
MAGGVCPVCTGPMAERGYAKYLDGVQNFVTVPVFYCKACDLFSKALPRDLLKSHLKAAAYALPNNERAYYRKKNEFFKFIVSLVLRYKNNPTMLDVGCSYGHLMMAAAEKGMDAEGVEINGALREKLETKGFRVYKDLFEVPERYDAITFIDSFFYFENPLDVLNRCNELLKEDGILLLRLTNRNWLAGLRWTLLKRRDLSVLGDTTHSYSIKSITRALNKTGFNLKGVHFFERGRMEKIVHRLAGLLAVATFHQFILTPGVIVVAKRRA